MRGGNEFLEKIHIQIRTGFGGPYPGGGGLAVIFGASGNHFPPGRGFVSIVWFHVFNFGSPIFLFWADIFSSRGRHFLHFFVVFWHVLRATVFYTVLRWFLVGF